MTSGVFHLVPMTDIIVKRDERQRRELTQIDVLADSIRRLGLIHPIVVTRSLELVAGERRYAACTMLGWPSIPVQYVDELSPETLEAIELEENIKRQDISWQDYVRAVNKYHKIRKDQAEGQWTVEQTGEAIGLSQPQTSAVILVAKGLEEGVRGVADAPKLSTAEGIMRRARERAYQTVLEGLNEPIGGATSPAREHEGVLVGDFCEWVHSDPGLRFNFVHCDFPYGIDADEFNQGGAVAHGGYADTPETWENLMIALEIATRRHVAPSAHLMFWFAMRKRDQRLYEYTARELEKIGWDINPLPLIWMKTDGAGIIPDPERGPRQIYETCFFGSRGDRKIVRAVANAYGAPTVRERHMSEKPEPMLRHFFGMLVDENTVMLDPTCGSGSSLRAAESLGAKSVLGLEINPEFAGLAQDALKRARTLRAAAEVIK